MRLQNKVAVVTGAGGGIGAAIVKLFEEEGAVVFGVDINPQGSDSVRQMDVARLDQWEALVADILTEHDTIDVLVNNAGIVHTYDGIADVDLEAWQHVLDVNMTGTFYGMRAVLPAMRKAGKGSIVNFSSIWGTVGASGVAPYQAAKGAVRTMTKNAAITYAEEGIRANSIHPGLTMTPMIAAQDQSLTDRLIEETPMKRGSDPRELAYGALYLACDESSFVTGIELVIDGGYLAV